MSVSRLYSRFGLPSGRSFTLTAVLALAVCLGSALMAAPAANKAPAANGEAATAITSDRVEMVSSEVTNQFFFYGNVKVIGTNLKVACDELEVIASRAPQSSPQATVGQIGAIVLIIAKGNVKIEQAGRVATSGRAELFPRDGKVILTDKPVVTDAQGVVSGHRMTLLKGERRALVEGGPSGDRPKVTLPTIPDMGFKDDKK